MALTYYCHEVASIDMFPFTNMKYYHNKVSSLVSFLLRFTAIRSFICLKFSTLALLKAFIVKTSFSLSLKMHLVQLNSDTFETKFTRHVSVTQRPSSVESRINLKFHLNL